MTLYLLDTNVVSETRKIKNGKADTNFIRWFAHVNQDSLHISVVVLMELQRGILSVARRDAGQAEGLRLWYRHGVLDFYRGRILGVDECTADICAGLHVPDKSPENDAWIAALALQHNLALVTRNTSDMQHAGIKLFNPFQESV